jgi:hypothetical protein
MHHLEASSAMSSLLTIGTTTEVRIVVMKDPVHPGAIPCEDVLAELDLGVGEAAARLGSLASS